MWPSQIVDPAVCNNDKVLRAGKEGQLLVYYFGDHMFGWYPRETHGLKDFDEAQHNKYRAALKEYRIIYLISKDCVIDIAKQILYTTMIEKYKKYVVSIPTMKNPNWFYSLIQEFTIIEVNDLTTLFGNS